MLALSVRCHIHIILGDFHGLHSLLILLLRCLVAILHIFLLNTFLNGLLLHLLLLFFSLLIHYQFLSLFLICFLQLKFFLFPTENSHLPVLSDLLQLLLFVFLLGFILSQLLLLKGKVFITNLFRFSIHNVSLHFMVVQIFFLILIIKLFIISPFKLNSSFIRSEKLILLLYQWPQKS